MIRGNIELELFEDCVTSRFGRHTIYTAHIDKRNSKLTHYIYFLYTVSFHVVIHYDTYKKKWPSCKQNAN